MMTYFLIAALTILVCALMLLVSALVCKCAELDRRVGALFMSHEEMARGRPASAANPVPAALDPEYWWHEGRRPPWEDH